MSLDVGRRLLDMLVGVLRRCRRAVRRGGPRRRGDRRHRTEVLALRREVADAVALVLEAVAGVIDHRLPAAVLALVLGRDRLGHGDVVERRTVWARGGALERDRRGRARRQELVRLGRPDHRRQVAAGPVMAVRARCPTGRAHIERLHRRRTYRVSGEKEGDGVRVADRRVDRLADRTGVSAAQIEAHRAVRCGPVAADPVDAAGVDAPAVDVRIRGIQLLEATTAVDIREAKVFEAAVGGSGECLSASREREGGDDAQRDAKTGSSHRDPPCRWQWCRTSPKILPRMLVPGTATRSRRNPTSPTYPRTAAVQPALWSGASW